MSTDISMLPHPGNQPTKQTKKHSSVGRYLGGFLVGSVASNGIGLSKQFLTPKIFGKIQQLSEGLSSDNTEKIGDSVQQIIKESGLAQKGVSIIKAGTNNKEEIYEIITKEYGQSKVVSIMPAFVKDIVIKNTSDSLLSGENACYSSAVNKIIVPENNKLSLAIFHEIGHAMNENFSKAGKVLSKCRGMSMLTLPIAAIALLKNKKADGEKSDNPIGKATDFIKENAGKLTFAAWVPVLAEEGLASIKGTKAAAQFLDPGLLKKVAKTNALGFSAYLLRAIFSSVGIYAGKKIRDNIAQPDLKKNEQ